MKRTSMTSLRSRTSKPLSDRSLETMVGVAIVLWVVGELLFLHSAANTWHVAKEFSLRVCFEAASFGCAIAVIAARRFGFSPAGLVGVGVFLFAAITVWNKNSNIGALALVLLLVAARGMDLKRLMRFYVVGATVALVLVLTFTKTGIVPLVLAPGGRVATSGYGFSSTLVLDCLFLSIVIALAYVLDEPSMRVPLALGCVLCGIACFLLLHATFVTACMLLTGAFVFFEGRLERWLVPVVGRREFRWLIAALPLVLICLCWDTKAFYPIASSIKGVYRSFVDYYGMAVGCCFAMLYVRSVLVAKPTGNIVRPWFLLCVILLASAFFDVQFRLEFNGLLLLLSIGMGGKVIGQPEIRVIEGGE